MCCTVGVMHKRWVELGPHLAQCGTGRDLPPYQMVSLSTQPFGHNRHGPKIGDCDAFCELVHNVANLLLRNVAYEKLNLTINLHRKQIFNVFYLEKRTENKKKTLKT